MRLIDVVTKKSNLECGTFGNISDDLAAIENLLELPQIIQMAYGYARRSVAAGLFLQGIFTYKDFQQAYTIFKSLQIQTGHTVEFQEEANDQAIELLTSYDYRLNKQFITTITTMAVTNDLGIQQHLKQTYEYVIQTIQKVSSEEFLSNVNSIDDQYEQNAELVKMSILAYMLEKQGKISEANILREQIKNYSNKIYSDNLKKFQKYIGNTDIETENNIFNAILPLIRNDDEYVQFVFEELDAASQGNDYSANFVKNCGIDSKYFRGSLEGSSSIDRVEGPQQFLSSSIITLFGGAANGVPHRINVVRKFIDRGFENGILSKYAFNNISSKVTTFVENTYIYKGSLTIESIKQVMGMNAIVIAIIKNNKTIYCNTYDNYIFKDDGDGSQKFRGPIYKIQLSLTTGDRFDIFYGFITNDRASITMSLDNGNIDENCVYILRELENKCRGIFDLNYYEGAPTRYTYHLYFYPSYIYVTNNMGSDAYFIALDGSRYENSTKDEILNLMRSYRPNTESQKLKKEEKQQSSYEQSVSIYSNIENQKTSTRDIKIFLFLVIFFVIGIFLVVLYNKNKNEFSYTIDTQNVYQSENKTTSSLDNSYLTKDKRVKQQENLMSSITNTTGSSSNNEYLYKNNTNDISSYRNMDILELLTETDKIIGDKNLIDYLKLNKLRAIYEQMVSKLKYELTSDEYNIFNQTIAYNISQIEKIKEFGENARLSESKINENLSQIYYFKIRELGYISSKIYWNSKLEYCKDSQHCTEYELSRIGSYFSDNYNNLREICQAGFCDEKILKEQERIWIEYSKNVSTLIDKNSSRENNLLLLKTFLTTNQNYVLIYLKSTFIERIANENMFFNFESNKTLYNSLITVQGQLKYNRISEEKLKKLNALLSIAVVPYVYYELKKQGVNTEKLEISAGAYDLTYRVFLVSSNKKYFGNTYDRGETELAKVEGKINRAKHALYLLLSDYDIMYINSSITGFRCNSTPCSNDDFYRNGQYLEDIYNKLIKQCKLNKCISSALYSQENNWVAYTKEWLKLLEQTKSNENIKNHLKVLYDNDNIDRLLKAYKTYQ